MAELPPTSPGGEFFQLSQLATLFAILQHTSVDPIRENVLWKTTVDAAVHLLCENLQSTWSIEKLAHAVALSPSQLSKLFAKSLGTSPSKFLREARAHRMQELLAATGITVYEAGRAVGWTNPSHAARAFRMVFGISPQQSRSNSHVSKDYLPT
jgi:two-component system response regulator YesN